MTAGARRRPRWAPGREAWVVVHRWAGLALAGFLTLTGLTGSLLAFRPQLSAWLDPPPRVAPRDAPPLDPLDLRERALAEVRPWGAVPGVFLVREPDEPFTASIEPAPGAAEAPLPFDTLRLDPWTAEVLARGRRPEGLWPVTRRNLVDGLVALHFRLAVPGQAGTWLLGAVALLWTLDCFVGFGLTLPRLRRRPGAPPPARGWWARWRPAWLVKSGAGPFRLGFDLHRAGGLWPWPLLLVLAWSGVAFNLREEIYAPVTSALLGPFENPLDRLPDLPAPRLAPALGWREAREAGRRLAEAEGARRGFRVEREGWLLHDAAKGLYFYGVRSDRDLAAGRAETILALDGDTGALAALSLPTGQARGATVTAWLTALHRGAVGGLAYRIVLCLAGLAVAMLSVTGAWLWRSGTRRVRSPPWA